MKSVCIIGAGPAGLVAAKTFLQSGAFKVTIYEQSHLIGGIWGFEKDSIGNNFLPSRTPTNLSRYTVSFSDLSWSSVHEADGAPPMFPAAIEVGRYLSLYQKKYVPLDIFRFGHRVVQAELSHSKGAKRWSVITEVAGERQSHSVFDYLVNAAGFFHSRQSFSPQSPPDSAVKCIHTSEYRSLDQLFGSNKVASHGKILVIGGGNSSGETAASVAFDISTSAFSPGAPKNRNDFSNIRIYHVTPRPLYAIPPFIPTSTESSSFAPLDLQFYELKWRPPAPICSGSGPLPPEVAEARYQAIHRMTGDQRDLGASALVTTTQATPYVALSESYGEYVRSGAIVPVAGRVTGFGEGSDTIVASVKSSSDDDSSINDVVAVIYATGYSPHGALSFLSEEVTQLLEYDATSLRLPILLQHHQTINPQIPNLALIGFYEGPYWGVMEMQARLVAQRWSSGHSVPSLDAEELDKLRALRTAIKNGATDVPQYWFSDYTGYLEELARDLNLRRLDSPFDGPRDGPVTPSRYLGPGDNEDEARSTMEDMKKTITSCRSGRYRPRAVFRALQGNWQLERRIVSQKPEMPSGTFTGTGQFHPRHPTAAGFDFEHLYIEQGSFVTDTGINMTASRRYVYRYSEASDTLSVWFVDVNDELSVDYLFHRLVFAGLEPEHGTKCKAHSEHLCEADFYTTDYSFSFQAISLSSFEIQHTVKGPGKDYAARGRYIRG